MLTVLVTGSYGQLGSEIQDIADQFPGFTFLFHDADTLDITDFGAEIEFTLGGETHLITTPTVVSVPSNIEHCPIVFKKVEKPLVFLEVSLTRIWKPEPPPDEDKKG